MRWANLALSLCVAGVLGGCSHDQSSVPASSSSAPPPAQYSVTVNVTGLTGTLVLEDNGSDSLTITANGNATFNRTLPNGASYAVTVLTPPANQSCTLGDASGTIASANVSNVTASCFTSVNATVPTGGATVQAPPYTVTFPANALSATASVQVTASITSDPTIKQRFDDGTMAFGNGLTFEGQELQVILQTATAPIGFVTVAMPLSLALQGDLTANPALTPLALYLQPYISDDPDDDESIDDAEPAASSFEAGSQTVTAQIPPQAFYLNDSGTYTAIVKLVLAAQNPTISAPGPTASAISPPAVRRVVEPRERVSNPPTQCATTSLVDDGSGSSFSNPLNAQLQITGPFDEPGHAGPHHGGIDFLAANAPVYAVRQGYIERVLWTSAATNGIFYVVVRHFDGSASAYLHLSPNSVMAGGKLMPVTLQAQGGSGFRETNPCAPQYPVARGEQIATSGSTGTSSPHLHLSMLMVVNPSNYLSQAALSYYTSANAILSLGTFSATFQSSNTVFSNIAAGGSDVVQLAFQDNETTPQEILVRRSKNPNVYLSVADRSANFLSPSNWPVLKIVWSSPPSVITLQSFDSSPPYVQTDDDGIIEDEGQAQVSAGSEQPTGSFTVTAFAVHAATQGAPPAITATEAGSQAVSLTFGVRFTALGLNSSGDIVGEVCPSGTGSWPYPLICGDSNTGPNEAPQSTAAAFVSGKFYPSLSSLVDLTPCGFNASAADQLATAAIAVGQDGSMLVYGSNASLGSYVTCLLTPAAPLANKTPQFTASPLNNFFGFGINGSGTVVGEVCPSGTGSWLYPLICGDSNTGPNEGPQSTAAAIIGGKLYSQLSSLVDLTPCGFNGSSAEPLATAAIAVGQDGSILVKGSNASLGSYITCLLSPTVPLADGTPQFTANPLSNFFGFGVNGSGTIVGEVCPSGTGSWPAPLICGNSNTGPNEGPQSTAAALIGGKFYSSFSSLVDLTPCGFNGSSTNPLATAAIAVGQDGSILLEGSNANLGSYITCLLAPKTPLADGTPQFVASPL